jgi:serine/threonine-protein kinase
MNLPAKISKYEIRRMLGTGAMGKVFEGFDPVIERRVAIKTIASQYLNDATESAVARFKREAQAAGRLQHPGIVAVYEYGEDAEQAYIVMEYLEGQTLRELLRKKARQALIDTYGLQRQLLMALDYSHKQGVVHRDIKPANLMVIAGLKLKVMDFGIARIESSSMTQTGSVLGTPTHMAPEQLMGQQADARADLWSAGVILYEMLTGHSPFAAETPAAVMHHVLQAEPPLPSQVVAEIGPGFDAVVARALAKKPEHRFQSAAEFSSALLAAFRGKPAREAVAPAPAPSGQTLSPEQTARFERTGTVGASRIIELGKSLSPQMLADIEASLTRAVGPIAHTLVKQSAARSRDVEHFYALLSESIPPGAERDAFIARVRKIGATQPPVAATRSTPPTLPPGPTLPGATTSAFDPEALSRCEKELARHVGPLAKMLVRKEAARARDLAALYEALAEQIDDDAERKTFLATLR